MIKKVKGATRCYRKAPDATSAAHTRRERRPRSDFVRWNFSNAARG